MYHCHHIRASWWAGGPYRRSDAYWWQRTHSGVSSERVSSLTLFCSTFALFNCDFARFQAVVRDVVKKDRLESGGLDGDEAVVHGAVLYGLSRHEPAALGRMIKVEEDEMSTGAVGRTSTKNGALPKALGGNAKEAAAEQLVKLRRDAAGFAAVAASRDRLERFVFKVIYTQNGWFFTQND